MKEYGVGVIGYGFMGKTHCYGYQTLPFYYPDMPFKIKLVGVCNTTLSKAEKAKDLLGFSYATSNADDIFNDPNIHIVNICTPNVYHKDMVIKAIKAGKHVYCDKPFVMNYAEAEEVIALAKEHHVTAQIALQNRFYPMIMNAKRLIDEGRLGKITSFRGIFLHASNVNPNKKIGWRHQSALGGGGVLFDLGSHILDLGYYLMGDYQKIMCQTDKLYDARPDANGNMVPVDNDDLALMMCQMKNGAYGTIEASKVATGFDDSLRFEIHGVKGAIKFDIADPNHLYFFDNTIPDAPLGGERGFKCIECTQRYAPPAAAFPGAMCSVGWIRAHVHCLATFLYHVDDGTQPSPSLEEGAYIQKVMERAYESDAKGGAWVSID